MALVRGGHDGNVTGSRRAKFTPAAFVFFCKAACAGFACRYALRMSNFAYRFGDCVIDPATRVLRRAGRIVSLPPNAFDCIAYLIEHRDRAVGRDELIAAVWGKADVDDAQLAHVVRKARRAIGDNGTEQSAIHTLPRFGFRWAREVELRSVAAGEVPPAAPAFTAPAAEAKAALPWQRIRRPGVWVPLCVSAILLVVGYLWHGHRTEPAVQDVDSALSATKAGDAIAVLPVDTGTITGSEWAWLRLGLMDLISTRLRDAGLVVVTSSNVVALLRDKSSSASAMDELRSATGARYLIAPSLAKSSSGWVARLSWGENGQFTNEVEAHAKDAPSAAIAVTERVLDQLDRRRKRGAGSPTDLPATELFQRAEAAALVGDFSQARRLLTSAPSELRDSPELLLNLARVELRGGDFESASQRFAELEKRISAENDPALRARALIGLGTAKFRLRHFDEVEPLMTEALVLLTADDASTDVGEAFLRRGSVHLFRSRIAEAAADFSRARIAFELAGDSLALARVDFNMGVLQDALGRTASSLPLYERAARQFDRFGAMPDLVIATSNQITTHLDLMQPAEALRVVGLAGTRFEKLDAPHLRHLFKWQHARALLGNGRVTEARVLLDELVGGIDPQTEAVALSRARAVQAQMALDADAHESAAALALDVVRGPPGSVDETTRTLTWLIATRALRALGRNSEAAEESRQFRAWAGSTAKVFGDETFERLAQLGEAEQARAEKKYAQAVRLYEDVLAWSIRSAPPARMAEVAGSYLDFLLDQGNIERATAIAGQLGPWAESDFRCAQLRARLYRALGQTDAWQTALVQVRRLAGERPVPTSVAAAL
ncbi:winged helix-turn-helix domain-containing protein [Dokdonella ginsengisoli]|uniref:Winged helix-turn-helix domain-containing protein n=1 Tax=Dokdonella ginsengisoli TaxID=363846 RepID=A0ABV9QSX6_9GAMM